ncbi:MAG: helicase-related protein [Longimicrobiales bacterium]
MVKLEDLKRGAVVKGVVADGVATVVDIEWHGTDAVTLVYRDGAGRIADRLLFRSDESTLDLVTAGRPWSFDSDGHVFRLVSEAHRIRLAHLFDPMLAVHTSLVHPLPHQITAVYSEMLPRQPLRFLLADDPGSGKTIMAGLLIKELMIRGDLRRCMIICPGMLVEQWQDELDNRFGLPFEIMTNDKLEAARTGNWLGENDLVICRLDKLSRDEDLQEKLKRTDWDLVVVDEAHKMSASYFGSEAKYTKRYHLGRLASGLTRHFLLMTATPHNGKEEDFQLFLALLDGDRFEGKFRDGVHVVDASDIMRRMVKEQLVKFDGKPLFPERRAYTVSYELSDAEAALYKQVTDYVREEFNRAEALENDGRKGTVGFALTILQRRLASSPDAIYHSLRRRRGRLEKRLREVQVLRRGASASAQLNFGLPRLTDEDLDDLEDLPGDELEETEEQFVDEATAARTVDELAAEIAILHGLETLAQEVRRSGRDRKWEELSRLLQTDAMFTAQRHRRKLIIFTEHRDTLNYLTERIRTLLGRQEAVVTIHGGMGREDRKKAETEFLNDPDVEILIATDAAGEGINLQRAHLMVNYDLPWNPNRLEQRFGRIHRIGQTEVCHLWNLVAEETREGDVFRRLFEKLEVEREALGGAVFDVLGNVLRGRELRNLLVEAIRYGDQPEVRARLDQVLDSALDHEQLRQLLSERALARETLDPRRIQEIRDEMERADARRLQPHFIASFFRAAFEHLGGTVHEREPRRYQVKHIPAPIRSRDRQIGTGAPIPRQYERITFEKSEINVPGKPRAEFVCPGHPLLDATTDLILERYRTLLKRGAVLIDPADAGTDVRALCYLEHAIHDGRPVGDGARRVVSRQMQFVEMNASGEIRPAGHAPYLDYRPATEAELAAVAGQTAAEWLRENLESKAVSYAIANLAPKHFEEVKRRKEELATRTLAAVHDRLTKEIAHWDHRAAELQAQEQAGRQPRMNSQKAWERADELRARLQRRMEEIEQERNLSPAPPVVVGGALVIPSGLLAERGLPEALDDEDRADAESRRRIELAAMAAVIAAERALGHEPRDVSADKCGYDVESRVRATGSLRFIEVKGRAKGADTVTITKNEILTGLNKPDDFILAMAIVDGDAVDLRYVRRPFQREPDFGVTSINYDLKELWRRGTSADAGTEELVGPAPAARMDAPA